MAIYDGSTLIAEKNPAQVSAAEKTAGTETGLRSYSPKDVADIVAAHGGGGIGGLEFSGLTANHNLGTSFANVVSGNYTPATTSEVVGLLLSIGTTEEGTTTRFKLRRGTTDITPEIQGVPADGFHRQLFLDKPNSTSQQSYALQGRRTSGTRTIYAGSSLTVLGMPDSVVADIITSDETLVADTDFLSVSITPSSTSAKIKLNILALTNLPDWDMGVMRGTTELVEATLLGVGIDPSPSNFPSNFEDWVDEPNTTNAVTYTSGRRLSAPIGPPWQAPTSWPRRSADGQPMATE